MQYQPKEVYIGGFNPVYECMLNGFLLIAGGKLGLMFAAIVMGGEILLWVSVFLIMITLLRARRWHEKWQDRELRIKCIEINYIESLSDDIATRHKKQQVVSMIKARASKVWWSYVLFFLPHITLFVLCWWLLNAWKF